MMKRTSNGYKIFGITIIVVVLILSTLLILNKFGVIDESTFRRSDNVEKPNTTNEAVSTVEPQPISTISNSTGSSIIVRPRSDVWVEMHKMSNTKIVAEEVWGEINIDIPRVDRLIEEVTESNFDDKEVLLKTLNNWRNSDFSNAVEEHNYLWGKLGGTVGKATGLKKSDIN